MDVLGAILLFMLTLFLSVMAGWGFTTVYAWLQALVFRTAETILFVQGDWYILISLVTFCIIGFCVRLWLETHKAKYWSVYIPYVVVGVFLLGTLAQLGQFFNYSRITAEGVFVRQGVISERHYSWEHVHDVDLSCRFERGSKGPERARIYYVVTMDDGRSINLSLSKDFGNKILEVDALFEKNGVPIVRHPIPAINYLKRQVSNDDYFNTLLKLFRYEPPIK